MTIRIDPGVPLVWRTPHLVQLGVDDPICVLPATSATERILAALVAGVPPGAIEVVAEHAGATPELLEHVMSAVAPALAPEVSDAATSAAGPPAPSPVISLDEGSVARATGIARLLNALGMRTTTAVAESASETGPRPDAAVLAASFVVSATRVLTWLSRDIPHLPIVFGDRYVEVGPLVEPGAGPCLRCVSLHRRDADPAWPVIAAQLDGAAAPTVQPLPSALAAARAAWMLDDLLRRDDHTWATRSIRIDAASGDVSERAHLPHPECGCRVLPENVTALRRPNAGRGDAPSSATAASSRG